MVARSHPDPGGQPTLFEAFFAWVRVAALSFGGPAGQLAVIHRIIVEEKGWVDERRFLHALNYCMVLPGPEAMQMATYMGWYLNGTRGGIIAGGLFVLPGFLSILALSLLYVTYHDTTFVEALFFGLKAAVLAVVLHAVYRLGKKAVRTPLLLGIAGGAFLAIFFFNIPFPVILLGAALAGLVGHRLSPDQLPVHKPGTPGESEHPPEDPGPVPTMATIRTAAIWALVWLAPLAVVVILLGFDHTISAQALFFSFVAVVSFGGAYAVLAYVAQHAVETHGWLSPGEMIDGLGLAETTPGPLIQVTQFVGFLGAHRAPGGLDPVAAAIVASIVVTWAVFIPSFLYIFTGAPYIERLQNRPKLGAALTGITAAVVGVILNLAVLFGVHVLFTQVTTWTPGPLRVPLPEPATLDPLALILFVAAFLLLFHRRIPLLAVLLGTAAIGLALRLIL